MSKIVIFGYPGTGKTYTLMKIIDKFLSSGILPTNICFCSYTKSAAEEAKSRAVKQFNLKKEDMVYFGTIHSLCFRRFCIDKELVKPSHLANFFKLKNLEYEENSMDDELLVNETFGEEVGNKLINFYNLLRITECKGINKIKDDTELKLIFSNKKINEENFMDIFGNVFSAHKILSDYENYKHENNLIDFVDMLLMAYEQKWVVPTEILIVDEAQDMSPIQWALYDLWSKEKKEIIIAGDDDQSIYSFNGAQPSRLIKEKEFANETIILDKTYRTSNEVHTFCLDYINRNIKSKNRVVKNVISLKPGGEIVEENIDYDLERGAQFIRKDKYTYILFRTNNYKRQFISECLIPKGLIYLEIRGNGIWTNKSICIFNLIIKLSQNKNISPIETGYLIDSISGKFKLMKRGLKSQWEEMQKKESYSISDLIELGFNMELFSYLKDFKILNIMNLKDNLKIAFLNQPKKEIEYPIKLSVGTIHSSKGKEADDVILFKDITRKIAKEVTKDEESWENEIRVFHTGQTRTKERLIILRGGFEHSESDLIP